VSQLSPEEVAAFVARTRAEWAALGVPDQLPEHVLRTVARIIRKPTAERGEGRPRGSDPSASITPAKGRDRGSQVA
jgi:hypothetical protein